MRKTEYCGDIDSAIEQGRYELTSLPNSIFSKDKDTKRDREVAKAIDSMNYNRVHDDIAEIVKHTIDVLHSSDRYQRLLQMPHYAKITEDVIRDIYDKYYA